MVGEERKKMRKNKRGDRKGEITGKGKERTINKDET